MKQIIMDLNEKGPPFSEIIISFFSHYSHTLLDNKRGLGANYVLVHVI